MTSLAHRRIVRFGKLENRISLIENKKKESNKSLTDSHLLFVDLSGPKISDHISKVTVYVEQNYTFYLHLGLQKIYYISGVTIKPILNVHKRIA